MREQLICLIDRFHCAIDWSVVSATIDRSRNHRSIAAQSNDIIFFGRISTFHIRNRWIVARSTDIKLVHFIAEINPLRCHIDRLLRDRLISNFRFKSVHFTAEINRLRYHIDRLLRDRLIAIFRVQWVHFIAEINWLRYNIDRLLRDRLI